MLIYLRVGILNCHRYLAEGKNMSFFELLNMCATSVWITSKFQNDKPNTLQVKRKMHANPCSQRGEF